jgi:tripartite ATP-independent transporter DctM subunit
VTFMVIIVLFALFFLRVPIAFTIIASSILFLAAAGVPLGVQIQRMVAIADNFPLLAVPLFILAGEFMNAAGMTARLFAFANALVGHIRGGLAHVNIATSMLMAGMSGSAIADCAATTKVFVPVMVKSGYSKAFATAVTAASATIGPIIPPSIIFVVYGWLAGVSIGKLFLAGAVPGLLMGLYLMITVFFLAKKKNFGKSGESFSLHTLKRTTRDALLAMFMPLIILGGILGGVFTATEAAGVAVVYSFGVGTLIYRRLSLSDLPGILRATAVDTAAVMFIVAAAGPFGWILGLQQVPQILIQLFSSISNNPWVILLILNAGFLIIGCFMETTAIMLITVPLLMPLIHKVGIDPVHFGVVISVNLLIGTLTPPVGVLMFTTCGIAQIPVEDFITEVWPFYIALLFLLFTITYFPAVVLWLPKAALG